MMTAAALGALAATGAYAETINLVCDGTAIWEIMERSKTQIESKQVSVKIYTLQFDLVNGWVMFIEAPFPRISKPIEAPVRDLSDPEVDFYWNDPAHPNPENSDGTVSGWINRISGVGRFILSWQDWHPENTTWSKFHSVTYNVKCQRSAAKF
jgi:hypothetical protein